MVLRHHLLALYIMYLSFCMSAPFSYKSMKNAHFIALPLDTFLYFPQNRFGFIGLPTA